MERVAETARSAWAEDLSTVSVLVRRDLVRFWREKSRVVGALVQPLVFWLIIGSGMSGTFALHSDRDVGYMQYFYPGVVLMVVLFTAIFATMSVIEDRHGGFLQAVLVAPGSRGAVVLGKCLGAASVALAQAALFLALAPAAGFELGAIHWPLLLAHLTLACFSLCTLGFGVAWWLDSTAGYHVVMSLLLLPMWIMSGAMFPGGRGGWIRWVERLDPMSYSVTGVRRALYGGVLPDGTGVGLASSALELLVPLLFAAVAATWAVGVCHRRR